MFASFEIDVGTLEDTFWTAIVKLATTVPTTLGPSALTVIIFNSTITWPAFYFLPTQNFVASLFRLGAINRACKGGYVSSNNCLAHRLCALNRLLDYFASLIYCTASIRLFIIISPFCVIHFSGPGSQVPYRIYVDHGYIFACMIALGPLCPLIGPFGLFYFIIIAPMIRWVLVFEYRPIFDGGGDKWPKLHHMIFTSVLLGQVSASSISFKTKNSRIFSFVSTNI